ncbi:MAG TPA: hypothetical protein VE621_19175, partial [Bryobacteraceae bacterium]|nr:hypothetical protein [Bryobacteraceae bacterium]
IALCVIAAHGVQGQSALNTFPSRVVGQLSLEIQPRAIAPNILEGREFNQPFSIAFDRRTTPPSLYVADTFNNRVLGWRNATGFQNGQQADIVIGQLDFFSAVPQGPGIGRTTGLSAPTSLVVDSEGNLYVTDSGNNRILRFPRPFDDTSEIRVPNLVIGQTSLNTRDANAGGLSASSVAFISGTQLATSGLAFDSNGNLWASDPFNNRVLRYPASALAAGRNGPAADLVLGQLTFDVNTIPQGANPLSKEVLSTPSSIAFDPAGRLYVSDTGSRVLVFAPPTTSGVPAVRILGIPAQIPNQPVPTAGEYRVIGPEGLAFLGNNLLVADRGNSRVLRYDPFETWPAETPTPAPQGTPVFISPPAKAVLGQFDFFSSRPNRGVGDPSDLSLNGPTGLAVLGTEIFVADTGNNRMLVFPSVSGSTQATRVLGQQMFQSGAVNYIEGRELFLASNGTRAGDISGRDGAGIVVDTTGATPPRLYIADTLNNRILGYADARRVRPGDHADIVIGQPDFNRATVNSPGGQQDQPSDVGLFRPSGLAIDADGNLWVADSGNARVLRFGRPFDQQGRIRPNLVIGQSSLFNKLTDPSSRNMAYPFGIAFTVEGSLLVSDVAHNRVLFFRKPANGDFTNYQAAERVIGQSDFVTGGQLATNPNRLQAPRGISTDTDDRLYVADGAGRVLIYDRIGSTQNNPSPAQVLGGFNQPQGVWVNRQTGEIWIADTVNNRAIRFPRFDRLTLNPQSDYSIQINGPLALAQDSTGNLYVAEAINRVSIYYNGLSILHTANSSDRATAPGQIASIYPQSVTYLFGDQTEAANRLPVPTTLGDIQVLVADKPVPLYYASPTQINLIVPNDAPTSGLLEYQVVKASTGAILAVGQIPMGRVNPGLFVQGSAAGGQLSALNQDNTVNSPQNAAGRGTVIQLFGTGAGFIPNAPPDGEAPNGLVRTPYLPRVVIGTDFVPDANIEYSGLAPGMPGVWQINVKIPDTVFPTTQVPVAVQVESINSNRTRGNTTISTTIAVKQ